MYLSQALIPEQLMGLHLQISVILISLEVMIMRLFPQQALFLEL